MDVRIIEWNSKYPHIREVYRVPDIIRGGVVFTKEVIEWMVGAGLPIHHYDNDTLFVHSSDMKSVKEAIAQFANMYSRVEYSSMSEQNRKRFEDMAKKLVSSVEYGKLWSYYPAAMNRFLDGLSR